MTISSENAHILFGEVFLYPINDQNNE